MGAGCSLPMAQSMTIIMNCLLLVFGSINAKKTLTTAYDFLLTAWSWWFIIYQP